MGGAGRVSGLLLDTHALLWYAANSKDLPADTSRRVTEANEVYVSAASAWEIRTKARIGKLPGAGSVSRDVRAAVGRMGFRELPIDLADAERAGAMGGAHRDPFDRMLAAQALNRGFALVSNNAALDAFGVERVW